MRASNPLIAVGISAVVIFGTTSAASAQTESASDADSANSSKASNSERSSDIADVQASQLDRSDRKQTTESAQVEEISPESVATTATDRTNRSRAQIEIFVAPESPDSTKPTQATGAIGSLPQVSLQQRSPQHSPQKSSQALDLAQAAAEGAEGVAQEPEAAEEASPVVPAETEELSPEQSGEAVEGEELSPEEIDETTEELEQRGSEAEETTEETEEPDDQPPRDSENEQDSENVLPSDVEPSDLPDTEQPAAADDEIQPSAPSGDPSDSDPAPEYLDTDANPLLFPTTPEEVELLGTQPLTLEQAIESGLRNNEELQVTRLELQRLRAALRETQAEEYPDINANINLNYNANEQPDSTTTQETDPTTGQPTGEPSFEVDGTTASRSLALGGTVELAYPIYTSGRRPALIESAERQVRFQELQVEANTEDLILQITNDYYSLQEADEQVQIFRATLEEAERSLRDAGALERAGVGTRFDVLQAQVDVANALQNLRNQQSQQEIARRQLAERLNLNQTITLAAADPVEVSGVWDLSLEETIVAAYRNRAELEQQLVQREIAERNRRAALAQLGPQLTFQTSYGLNNTLASDPDSPNEEVGFLSEFQAALGLSMILFDGGAARAQARQAEADIAIAESNFANQRDQIRFDVEQAYAQLQSNFENIQTTALAVQQAVEALRLARLRFQAGVGTQTDVLQAQTALTQARFNNLQAILDYNRALASLQRQVSNYPEGYLNEVP